MVKQIADHVIPELSAIAQAPGTFFLIIVIISIIIWRAVSWHRSTVIDGLEARNKLQADQIADYKSKLSGATPDEAKSRLDALELQVKALSPRRLSVEQKNKIVAVLSGNTGTIDVAHDAAAPDAKALTGDFANAFHSAGWTVRCPMMLGTGNPPQTGVALQVANSASLSNIEQITKHALETAGIEFDIQPGISPILRELAPDIRLLISTKLT